MSTWFDGASPGRVAIVTGGSRGVGRTTTSRLAARGYAVVVNYLHDQQAAESVVETILAARGTALFTGMGAEAFDITSRKGSRTHCASANTETADGLRLGSRSQEPGCRARANPGSSGQPARESRAGRPDH